MIYGAIRQIKTPAGLQWVISDFKPHIAIRLKALFPKIDKNTFGKLALRVTPESCVDLRWLLLRYPMTISDADRDTMEAYAGDHEDDLAAMDRMLAPDYKPRTFALAKPLRNYQARGVEVHARAKALLLGDQLGLGKTVTAIGTFAAGGTLPALVVCPTHLAIQWRKFIGEFMPAATTHICKGTTPYAIEAVDVVIITYSKLTGWGDVFSRGRFKSVVFDECQELRRSESQKHKAARAIRESCDFALGLSGTPIYNYGGEIYNVLEVIAPGRIGARDEFYREWCSYMGNGRWLIKDPVTFGEYLRTEFLMLRRRREEVGLELPKVQRELVTVPHDPDVLKKIEGDATELARLVLHGSFTESGKAARELDARLRAATGVAKAPFVAEFVRLLVDSGEKIVLFGWHREVYSVWLDKLADLNPVMYTGSESPRAKTEAIESFLAEKEGAARVLIMSLRSGVGVDGIQAVCSVCVFGELDWSPGVMEQCIGRINRDGQIGGALAYFLMSDAGSDPVVSAVLNLKTSQATGLTDPDKATEIETLQVETGRVKKLAAAWLEKRK